MTTFARNNCNSWAGIALSQLLALLFLAACHGTSVMSPNQCQVQLAMRAYVTGKAPADVDGISLLPFLEVPSRATALESRIRFSETDFNTPSTLAGRYEASGLIDEAAVYYELVPKWGWVQFRENRLPELLAQKQRAATSSNRPLAAIPGRPGQGPRHLLTDRQNPVPRVLEDPPDPSSDPEARQLWDALKARFPGELPTESQLPRM